MTQSVVEFEKFTAFMTRLAVTLEHSANHPARDAPAHQDQHREQHEDHDDRDSSGHAEILVPEDQSLGPRWASASISTAAPSGSPATPIVALAGRCSPKPFT